MKAVHAILASIFIVTPPSFAGDLEDHAEFAQIREAILEALIDPESARFGEMAWDKERTVGCVTVNSKNRLGGYTGDQQVVVIKDDGKWLAVSSLDVSQDVCLQIAASVVKDD